MAPLDLTHVQFVLLACAWWLNDHGDPPNQAPRAIAVVEEVDTRFFADIPARETLRVLRRLANGDDI